MILAQKYLIQHAIQNELVKISRQISEMTTTIARLYIRIYGAYSFESLLKMSAICQEGPGQNKETEYFCPASPTISIRLDNICFREPFVYYCRKGKCGYLLMTNYYHDTQIYLLMKNY